MQIEIMCCAGRYCTNKKRVRNTLTVVVLCVCFFLRAATVTYLKSFKL